MVLDVRTIRYEHLALYTGDAVIDEEEEERGDDGEEEAAAEKGRWGRRHRAWKGWANEWGWWRGKALH